ncbi:hypothetical protein AVEN_27778-1 [Araneus ventricosus]|uniref:Uncharacterized protein n=1 Tax=Araneus ventricosus TaxID=182803 RepID=A0A4Y2RL20_ARAVE|nr:hypothetical protein AVEN_27778-1 [Araneus ventricosus]
MWTPQEKVQCVAWLKATKSDAQAQRNLGTGMEGNHRPTNYSGLVYVIYGNRYTNWLNGISVLPVSMFLTCKYGVERSISPHSQPVSGFSRRVKGGKGTKAGQMGIRD